MINSVSANDELAQLGICALGFQNIQKKILWSSSYAQRDSLILGATMTFYVPRLLKNIAKGYINQMIDVVLATDCRFVQRISLRALATGISNAKSLAFGTPNTKNKIYEMSQMLKNLPL